MPLLEGVDGEKKMSKSLGNYVGITEPAGQMFQKLVSLPDTIMWRYFELLSFKSIPEIESLKLDIKKGANPKDIKIILAKEIIERFHGKQASDSAHRAAGNIIKSGEVPKDCAVLNLEIENEPYLPIARVINKSNLMSNSAQTKDALKNSRVKVDGEIVDETFRLIPGEYLIQVGKKKIAKIILK
jgi:tyrosyl-tRNA synthetase